MRFATWLILSLAVLAGFISGALYKRLGKTQRHPEITPFRLIFVGAFLAAFIALLPLYAEVFTGYEHRGLKTAAFAFHQAMQIFTLDSDREILEGLTGSGAAVLYADYLSLLMVAAPLMTFGFAASFFQNLSASVRYFFRAGSDAYVFSELNERSLCLAGDIRKNHRWAAIVFTDVFRKNEEVSYELLERAKGLGAICFKSDITAVGFYRLRAKAQRFFFAIGEDENENLSQALKLIEDWRRYEGIHLYVFTTGVDGELLLNRVDKGKIKVRRSNEVRSLINRSLYQKGAALFEHALPMPEGEKKIGAVIIGLGRRGSEMLKALSWYCQMDGYRVELNVFDIDKGAEDRFTALAPELMAEGYNGVSIPGEASYTIRIHSGADVETKSFADEFGKLSDTTYVFIALGSDEKNIRTAVNLRMLAERMRIHPVIQAVVTAPDKKAALSDIRNYRGQPYGIDFIGDIRSCYSEKVIMDSELEADALRRHMRWGKEEEFWQYEYNYQSSIATAIHAKAKRACWIPGADKEESELTGVERDILENIEHRRWNAYMRSEGYVYSGSPEKSSRNDLGKMHHDLVNYRLLTEEEKRKDSTIGAK